MITTVLIALALAAAASGEDCSHTSCNTALVKYYKELGCKPVITPGACCASRYDCTAVLNGRTPDKCYLNGRSYKKNTILTAGQINVKCSGGCRCSKRGTTADLHCVTAECPELFQGLPPPGCIRLYSHDRCCSTGMHCANASQPATKNAFTCAYGGKNYIVGEKFYPTESPCLKCICQEGYDGTFKEPWCEEVNCGIELHYGPKIRSGCAPIHYGQDGCCPIGWRCPEHTDSVIHDQSGVKTKGAAECVFGSLHLKVGDTLNSEKSCVECKCNVPPHISCVKTGHC